MDFSACSTADHHHQPAAIKNKRAIVYALVAQKKNERNPPPRRPLAATSVSVFKVDDQLLAEKVIARLNLSGCAVISKGVFVVEGPTSSIQRFSRLMGLNSVTWQGRVRRPSFERLKNRNRRRY